MRNIKVNGAKGRSDRGNVCAGDDDVSEEAKRDIWLSNVPSDEHWLSF